MMSSLAVLIPFGIGAACAVICSWLFYLMQGELRAKLPENQRPSLWFDYPGLLFEVERLHRQLYPTSRLRLSLNVLLAAAFLSGLTGIIALLWFEPHG